MARRPDKSPEEIRFLLNRKGLTFADIDRIAGLKDGVSRKAARHPYRSGERAIAKALTMSPMHIWPSRYDPKTGLRLKPQPKKNYTDQPRLRTSQKRGTL